MKCGHYMETNSRIPGACEDKCGGAGCAAPVARARKLIERNDMEVRHPSSERREQRGVEFVPGTEDRHAAQTQEAKGDTRKSGAKRKMPLNKEERHQHVDERGRASSHRQMGAE